MSDQKKNEEESKNHNQDSSDAYKYILAFVGGIAAGVALGFYLNSNQGKKLRKQFTNRMSEMEAEIESKVSSAMEEINKLADKGSKAMGREQEEK